MYGWAVARRFHAGERYTIGAIFDSESMAGSAANNAEEDGYDAIVVRIELGPRGALPITGAYPGAPGATPSKPGTID